MYTGILKSVDTSFQSEQPTTGAPPSEADKVLQQNYICDEGGSEESRACQSYNEPSLSF